jgi:hypothetical protein
VNITGEGEGVDKKGSGILKGKARRGENAVRTMMNEDSVGTYLYFITTEIFLYNVRGLTLRGKNLPQLRLTK